EYRGPYAYSVTLVTTLRRPLFTDTALVAGSLHHLGIAAGKYGFDVIAYCFMPDHLHLLVTGDEWSSLNDFMRHFKQLTGYYYKQETGEKLWQTSYWDRIARAEDDLEDVARYIWGNPVRAGLVTDYRDYAASGPRPMLELI
ncbi:MAG: transposase, partial [Dehalococcoidia bacterium]